MITDEIDGKLETIFFCFNKFNTLKCKWPYLKCQRDESSQFLVTIAKSINFETSRGKIIFPTLRKKIGDIFYFLHLITHMSPSK